MNSKACPCQSGKSYSACCALLHNHTLIAETAEQLMRSRYSAFVMANIDYLIATLHTTQRRSEDRMQLQQTIDETQWLGLQIIDHHQHQNQAEVEFIAFYQGSPIGQLHERSRFVKEDNQWFYVDGELLPAIKLGRNEPCFCGSGKKLKRCHG
jgi:SEC-C motif-containing protein